VVFARKGRLNNTPPMKQLKISTRLFLLVGTLSVLLVGIGAVGLAGIVRADDALQTVYEDRTVPLAEVAEIQQRLLRNRLGRLPMR